MNLPPIFDKNGNISSARLKKYGYSRLMNEFRNSLLQSDNPIEHLYWTVHNLTEHPKKCLTCNNKILKFDNFSSGYTQEFCSLSCMQRHDTTSAKKQLTMLKNYGEDVTNPSQLSFVSEKKSDTCMKNRGTTWPSQHQDVILKRVSTYRKRYGVDNPNQATDILHKRTKQFSINHWQKELEKEITSGKFVNLRWDESLKTCIVDVDGETLCADDARRSLLRSGGCRSSLEKIIYDKISTWGIDLIVGNRQIISPFEIDFALPSHKIAIEVNGTYWHNYPKVPKHYHRMKSKMCKLAGWRLIHIFEHEMCKIDLILSSIEAMVGRGKVIQARKTVVKEISHNDAMLFLNANHRHGGANSSYNIGLFYDGNIVACATFSKSRFDKSDRSCELVRGCTKSGYRIIGGMSKLLKYAETALRKRGYDKIITYSHIAWGYSSYESMGFTKLIDTDPGYVYVKGNEVLNRIKAQKHKLCDLLEEFDDKLTEDENMIKHGFYKIYDCGCEKFIKMID